MINRYSILFLSLSLTFTGCAHRVSSDRTTGFHPLRRIASWFSTSSSAPSKSTALAIKGTDVSQTSSDTIRQELTTQMGPAVNRYALTQKTDWNLSREEPAARISEPADYRVLYFPGETGDVYSQEGSREIVRVQDERMGRNVFDPMAPAGAYNMVSGGPNSQVPTARSYVAPDRSVVSAAMRLSVPTEENTTQTAGIMRMTNYRRAKAKVQGQEVFGMVRALGFPSYDDESLKAAASALDRRAGEMLVYFPDFGFGGFVPDPIDH